MEWKLADAKNRFSELFNRALSDGPQRVMRRGDAVMVLAQSDYEKLVGPRLSFKEFLLSKTAVLDGIDLERDRSAMRDVDL